LQELAVAYNYSQNYLRNLINRGNLKATKRGKLWYVRVRDMLKYIKIKIGYVFLFLKRRIMQKESLNFLKELIGTISPSGF